MTLLVALSLFLMQRFPSTRPIGGSSGAFFSKQFFGYPFTSLTVYKTEFLFTKRTPEFEDQQIHFTGTLVNLIVSLLLTVGVFFSTKQIIDCRTIRLVHLFALLFSVSICLGFNTQRIAIYAWFCNILSIETTISQIPGNRPLWHTTLIYMYLFAEVSQ